MSDLKTNDFIKHIRSLHLKDLNRLFAIYMTKNRAKYLKTLPYLLYLDDEYKKIYDLNKVNGFVSAQLIANEHILNLFYNEINLGLD